MDEEGFDLLGKRTMDFKVSYLDTGLASTYFSEADQLVVPPSGSPNSLPPPVTPTRPNRRYKTQLRDFLSTCRSKRKMQQQTQQNSPLGQVLAIKLFYKKIRKNFFPLGHLSSPRGGISSRSCCGRGCCLF